jgi:LmbE family N-acetylglucosaminyl deacetylase
MPLNVVVVAHPDDEALWLSSVLGGADRVVFCFGEPFDKPAKGAARRLAVAALPLTGVVDIGLPESGARFLVDWANAQVTPQGIAITEPEPRGRYEENFMKLVAALRGQLHGAEVVHTHNPWGEYGHAEHIQVYRAVRLLQAEFGFTIWFSNYVSSRSWVLAHRLGQEPCWTRRRMARPDRQLARTLMSVYRRFGVWTWARSHIWPVYETLYAQPPAGESERWQPLTGEWLLDVGGLRWWRLPWQKARRRLV